MSVKIVRPADLPVITRESYPSHAGHRSSMSSTERGSTESIEYSVAFASSARVDTRSDDGSVRLSFEEEKDGVTRLGV